MHDHCPAAHPLLLPPNLPHLGCPSEPWAKSSLTSCLTEPWLPPQSSLFTLPSHFLSLLQNRIPSEAPCHLTVLADSIVHCLFSHLSSANFVSTPLWLLSYFFPSLSLLTPAGPWVAQHSTLLDLHLGSHSLLLYSHPSLSPPGPPPPTPVPQPLLPSQGHPQALSRHSPTWSTGQSAPCPACHQFPPACPSHH